MRIELDQEADAIYFYIKEGEKIARTEEIKPGIIYDYGKSGELIGIEVLGITEFISSVTPQ